MEGLGDSVHAALTGMMNVGGRTFFPPSPGSPGAGAVGRRPNPCSAEEDRGNGPAGMAADLLRVTRGIFPSSPPAVPAVMQRSVTTGTITDKVYHFYRSKDDLSNTKPMVLPSVGQRPTHFNTAELRAVRMFVLSTGGSGMSQSARADYWRLQHQLERAARPVQPGGVQELGPFEKTFPTSSSFVRALSFEQDRCLYEMGWKETRIRLGGETHVFHWRDLLDVMVESLEMASDVRVFGEPEFSPGGERLRSETMNSDLFLDEQAEVMSRNRPIPGEKPLRFMPFMAGTQIFTDGALVSWNGGMRVGSHYHVCARPFMCDVCFPTTLVACTCTRTA